MHRLAIITAFFLCTLLQPIPAYAVWEYSLAALLAMHDGLRTTCGKIEPRLSVRLNDEWSQIIRSYKVKDINTARKSQEYMNVYRQTLHEYLINSWNDPEEESHLCEALYAQHNDENTNGNPWWHDRSCANVSLDSEDGSRCKAGPRVSISFGNAMLDKKVSILRIAPSSDVSFPRAGTFVEKSDFPDRVVSNNYVRGTWAIPESIEFEWKEWPSALPKESSTDHELKNLRNYVDQVRVKTQRKYAKIKVQSLIPSDVIATLLQSEHAAKSERPTERSMKLFFIFMQDGLRVRWEQWHGECIESYGGDDFSLPRDQLLSSNSICDGRQPKLSGN